MNSPLFVRLAACAAVTLFATTAAMAADPPAKPAKPAAASAAKTSTTTTGSTTKTPPPVSATAMQPGSNGGLPIAIGPCPNPRVDPSIKCNAPIKVGP